MQKIKAPSLKASHPEIKITADLEGGNELETVETIPRMQVGIKSDRSKLTSGQASRTEPIACRQLLIPVSR